MTELGRPRTRAEAREGPCHPRAAGPGHSEQLGQIDDPPHCGQRAWWTADIPEETRPKAEGALVAERAQPIEGERGRQRHRPARRRPPGAAGDEDEGKKREGGEDVQGAEGDVAPSQGAAPDEK